MFYLEQSYHRSKYFIPRVLYLFLLYLSRSCRSCNAVFKFLKRQLHSEIFYFPYITTSSEDIFSKIDLFYDFRTLL